MALPVRQFCRQDGECSRTTCLMLARSQAVCKKKEWWGNDFRDSDFGLPGQEAPPECFRLLLANGREPRYDQRTPRALARPTVTPPGRCCEVVACSQPLGSSDNGRAWSAAVRVAGCARPGPGELRRLRHAGIARPTGPHSALACRNASQFPPGAVAAAETLPGARQALLRPPLFFPASTPAGAPASPAGGTLELRVRRAGHPCSGAVRPFCTGRKSSPSRSPPLPHLPPPALRSLPFFVAA
jgi:hypothetical protein